MSLKAFHILFLIAAVLITLGFGLYALIQFKDGSSLSYLIMGIFSSVLGIALAVYSKYILKKLKAYSLF